MPRPSNEGLALGNLRLGTSVRLRSTTPSGRQGCGRGWLPVQPRGYVCLGRRTTLDLNDPYYRALADLAPQRDALMPYHYAYSRGAPMYSRVPTQTEWTKAERRFGPPGTYAELGDWARGHEELVEAELKIGASGPVPWYFEGGRRQVGSGPRDPRRLVWRVIPNGSMLAYAKSFSMHGRVWLVTPDLMLVPADRTQHLRTSSFGGTDLDERRRLPIAFNRRHEPRPVYRRSTAGAFVATDESLAGKAWRMIVDHPIGPPRDRYYPLRDQPEHYLRGRDLSIARKRKKRPRAIGAGELWIDAHIVPGTIVVYRDLEPLYVTLFSPGKGGAPVPGLDHTKYATTQTGVFHLEWKERVATMSNESGEPKVLWFSDVPNVQYVRAPMAMHVAYWHEDFGNPKSAECLNLSPRDGRRLFQLSDPPLPEGWGAVRPGGGNGRSTAVVISAL